MAVRPPDPPAAAASPTPTVGAAVLCGGASRRLGVDKASQSVGGLPLAVVMGRVARLAGAVSVMGIGARPTAADALAAEGMGVVADRWPGEGPVGGVVTALRASGSDLLVVLGCDHPWLRPATVATLVQTLTANPGCAAVVAEADGWMHPTVGVWRVAACVAPGETYFVGGGRSLSGLADHVGARSVVVDVVEVRDVDTPDDLASARAGLSPGTLRGTVTDGGDDSTTTAPTWTR